MSRNQRIAAVVAAVAVLVVAFFVLRPDDEEPPPPTQTVVVVAPPSRTATAATPPATTTATPPPPSATTTAAPPPPPATTTATPPARTATATTPTAPRPRGASIRLRGGQPVGGVKRIEVTKGDDVVIVVSSRDTSGEIHLHGYDLKRDLKAGGSVKLSFTADADGIYEIELEGSGVQIGKLVVQPG